MANIYQQQATSDLANKIEYDNPYAKGIEAIGQKLEQKSSEYFTEAKKLYSSQLNLTTMNTLNDLYNQNPNNPEALEKAFSKAYDKTLSTILDNDVKVEFMANAMVKSQPFINKAIDNREKLVRAQQKSSNFDAIYANNNNIGLAFTQLIDHPSEDTFGSYNDSYRQNHQLINALDNTGMYMFTDDQRKRMIEDSEKAKLNSLMSRFNDMSANEKEVHLYDLRNDDFSMVVGIDKEGNPVRGRVGDQMQADTYEKYVDYVEKVMNRKNAITEKYPGVSPDDAARVAADHVAGKQMSDLEWDNIDKITDIKDRAAAIFGFREGIEARYLNNKLDEKDFNDFLQKSQAEMNDLILNNSNKVFDTDWFFKSSYDGAISFIKDRLDSLTDPNDKMFIAETIYRQLKDAGIYDGKYKDNTVRVNDICDNVFKAFLKSKAPGVPDNVNRVLLGGHIYNYIPNPDPEYIKRLDKVAYTSEDGHKYYMIELPSGKKIRKEIYK